MARAENGSRDLHFLFEASRKLNRTLKLAELLAEIRDLTTHAMDAEACSLLIWNESRTRLEFYLAYDRIWEERSRFYLRPGEGMGGWIAEHETPVLCNDTQGDPRFRHVIDRELGFVTRSLLGLPLHRAGRVLGVLEMLNKKAPEGFTEHDLRLLRALGDQISVALDHALIYQEARRERAENEALYRIGLVLNEKLELEEIIGVLLDQVKEVVPYDAAALYLIRRETSVMIWFAQRGYPAETEERVRLKLGQGAVGWVASTGQSLRIPDVTVDDRYFAARPSTRSELVVPIVSGKRVIGILNLESDHLDAYRSSDLRILGSFANQAAISIERARLYAELKEKERLEHELHVARTIQKSFLPAENPVIEGYDLSAINLPSRTVSGDAYDFIPIADGQLGIMISDVSGKGVSAALIMATLRASLRAEIRNHFSITQILAKVNALLAESIDPGNFVTAVYGVLDEPQRIFTYVNAGHNPPIWIHRDGRAEELRTGGPILGPFPEIPYRLGVAQLEPGDLLVFYTDGVTEAGGPRGTPYGAGRLTELLRDQRNRPAAEICRRVVEDVGAYAGPQVGADDVTLIALRVL